MKIDQIAFYCYSEIAEQIVKNSFGLLDESKWIKDTVKCTNRVTPPYGTSYSSQAVGHLQFNYDLGIELEILRYSEGKSWHNHIPADSGMLSKPFISHVGIHLDDDEDFPPLQDELCWKLVQETFTHEHTNEYVVSKRRKYHYRIFESVPGTYIKYIKRIEMK